MFWFRLFHFSVNKPMLNGASRSPYTPKSQLVDEKRLELWDGSPLAVLLQEAIQKFYHLKAAWGKIIL